MDFDPDWRNKDEISPIQWKNTQHIPSPYSNFKSHGNCYSVLEQSDPLYAPDSDLSNQSHFPYCSSPERLGYFNYFPESHLSNEMNRNMKYALYSHQPFRYNDVPTYSSCHQFHNDLRLNTEPKTKKYSQICQHQPVNMYYGPYQGNNYSTKTNHTPLNVKKKRKQANESKCKRIKAIDSSDNASVNYTYEELIINNPSENWDKTTSCLTTTPLVSHDTTGIEPFINLFNRQHFFPENKDESCLDICKENSSNIYSLSNTKNITSKVEGFHEILSTSVQDGNHIKSIKEENSANYLKVSDTVHLNIKKIDIDKRNTEVLDQTDATVEDTSSDVTTKNTDILITESIYLEEGLDNVILQPIFEGKDENGEDVIILLASTGIHQEMSQENANLVVNTELISSEMADISKESKELIPLNNTEFDKLAEFQPEEDPCSANSQQNVITKTLNENYKESGLQIEGTDIFFSNINNFVSEEAEVAIEKKSSNTKRTKKQESQLQGNTLLKRKLNQRKVNDNFRQINDSKPTEFEEEKLKVHGRTSLNRNQKKLKVSYKQSKFKWKSNYRSKSTMPFKSFKNLFISEIINLFKIQDVNISRNKTWEIIKNQIGCSILQSIFSAIQLLAKSEIQKSKNTVSKKE